MQASYADFGILSAAPASSATGEFLRGFFFGGLASPVAAVAIVALYVAKSALGINLIPGPSILHDSFAFLAR